MIATRFMELRKRRGLMITLILVTIGIPTVFLAIRLMLHAVAPKSYGPAGGYDIYTGLVAGVLYVFGFIVAATLGCTAGSVDLTEGMFRHLVVTGRSRLALYLARIPAGLAIIVPLVAIGFTIVCAVCVFAAPDDAQLQRRERARGPVARRVRELGGGPSRPWCSATPRYDSAGNLDCGGPATAVQAPEAVVSQGRPGTGQPDQTSPRRPSSEAWPSRIAAQDYADYRTVFLYPSNSLMIKTGLWIELEATIGFIVGLGLGSLLGQRTVAVIMMIVLEIVLTPIVSRAQIPHMSNLQRVVVGLATAHLRPGGLPAPFGGGGGGQRRRHSCCRSRPPWPSASSSPGWSAGPSSAPGG